MALDFTPGFNLGVSDFLRKAGGSISNPKPGGSPKQGFGGFTSMPLYTPSSGGGSGGTTQVAGEQDTNTNDALGTNTNNAPVDPYSKYGGKAKYDNLMSGFDAQKQNVFGTSREAAQGAAAGRQGSILDFIQQLQSGQQGLDERGVQNELGLRQGRGSILDMVGRGVRQGGTMLAGKNALDSSAAEGVARAYGSIGQRQLSNIGNQYELENRDIGLAQTDFDAQKQAGLRKFDENKVQVVNGIVADARNRLAQLDAAMVEADVPTRIQIEQEKEAIKSEALGILSQYDQELTRGASGVAPTGVGDRRRTAADLATRGMAAANPFEFSSQVPAQFSGTGPFASELPLFSLNRQRRQEA